MYKHPKIKNYRIHAHVCMYTMIYINVYECGCTCVYKYICAHTYIHVRVRVQVREAGLVGEGGGHDRVVREQSSLVLQLSQPRVASGALRVCYMCTCILCVCVCWAHYAHIICAYACVCVCIHICIDDDYFYFKSWRNNVVIAFGTLSSLKTGTLYIHINTYTEERAHIPPLVHRHTHPPTPPHSHTNTQMCVYDTYVCTCMCVCMCACMYLYSVCIICACEYVYVGTCACIYMHTYTLNAHMSVEDVMYPTNVCSQHQSENSQDRQQRVGDGCSGEPSTWLHTFCKRASQEDCVIFTSVLRL